MAGMSVQSVSVTLCDMITARRISSGAPPHGFEQLALFRGQLLQAEGPVASDRRRLHCVAIIAVAADMIDLVEVAPLRFAQRRAPLTPRPAKRPKRLFEYKHRSQ